MTGDLRQVRLGVVRVGVESGAELAQQLYRPRRAITEEACGVPLSQQLRDRTDLTFQASKTSDGLTASRDDRKTIEAIVSPTFHKNTGDSSENRETLTAKKSGGSIVIDFQMLNIQTGRYVGRFREEAKIP